MSKIKRLINRTDRFTRNILKVKNGIFEISQNSQNQLNQGYNLDFLYSLKYILNNDK